MEASAAANYLLMMKCAVCVAVLVAVLSASYPPHPPPFYGPVHRGGYGGAGGHGGGIDPLTYLLLQKKGGLGKNSYHVPVVLIFV